MGSYRLSRWAFFLMPLFAFADFGVSDSATLNQIAIDVAHVANTSQTSASKTVEIASDTAYIASLTYDAQQNLEVMQGYLYRLANPGLRSITNGIWSIWDKINTDHQRHFLGTETTVYQDSIYTHDVRNDDIFFRLGHIESAINNLTNYLCYSPQYVAGVSAIYTNFPALFSFVTEMDNNALYRSLFYSLVGRYPTTEELAEFANITRQYGLGNWFAYILQYGYSYYDLPANLQSLADDMYYGDWGTHPSPLTDSYDLEAFTKIHYYQYGTRQLTDVTIGISNLVANITNLLFDVESGGYLEQDTSPGGHGFRVGAVVKDGVSSVMDDVFFTGTVSTNIVGSIDTNNILQVADNSYNQDLNELKSSTPQDFTELDGVLSEINTASGAIESVAEALSQDHNSSYILRLPFSMPRVGSVDLSLTLDNMTSHTAPVINLFCHFLQIAIAIYFFRVGWSRVVATVNFHNEEDPF